MTMRRLIIILAVFALAACSSHKAPVVGISSSRSASGSTLLSTAYTEAVSKSGGVPVVLPAVATREEADALLDVMDGIVFSGGEDVNPAWYGESIWNDTVGIDHVRDRSDSLLARAALESGKPILAICRGEQLMNVILGGSLYQDIPSQVPETVGHGGGTRHMIVLEDVGFLRKIFDADSLEVNSYHHQAVKEPAPGIRIVARSAEGIVEAFETDRVWAVQFHPEKMIQQGETRWLDLFREFTGRL